MRRFAQFLSKHPCSSDWSLKAQQPCLIYTLTLNNCIPVIWQSQETRIPEWCESFWFLTKLCVIVTTNTQNFILRGGGGIVKYHKIYMRSKEKKLSTLFLLFMSKHLTKLKSTWSSMNCKKGGLGKHFI